MSDHERFRQVVEPLHDRALAFTRALCRSNAEGDDVFQEALLRAFAKLHQLEDPAAAKVWFYRIIVSVQRSRARRGAWRRWLPLVGPDDDDAVGEVDYRSAGWDNETLAANRRIRNALRALPADQREAIVLYEIEGWLVEEIAALHGVSTSAIKSRLARGRDRLRTLYTDGDADLAFAKEPT